MNQPAQENTKKRIGMIDTGVNPWHSHVRGGVTGCRIFLDNDGKIQEDDDFRDLVGHGTAVAGIFRQQLPDCELFVVRVFEQDLSSFPSLVARALLRAASEGCSLVNLSLAMPPGPGADVLSDACTAVLAAGCRLVAAGHPDHPALLPAAISGVIRVLADDLIPPGEIICLGDADNYAASGRPRSLDGLPDLANLWGNSFACARVSACLAT